MSKASILYISYDGITDHIGQSQIAPYLIGLSQLGHRITLLTAEKMERQEIIEKYRKVFKEAGVDWHYTKYHKRPAVISTVWDLYRMAGKASGLIKKNNVNIIHTRSYVSSLLGLRFKKKKNLKFIFDMRDFWPDAAKEIKRFDVENNFTHRAVYNYFKKKEKEFIENADHIISLTEAGKKVIEQWNREGVVNLHGPITVIPCCADFSVFDRSKLDEKELLSLKEKFGIKEEDFVLNYLGSLGPSYLTDEMMDVFNALLKKKPNAKFLIIANNDHHLAVGAAERKKIDSNKIIITKATKEEVPYFIAMSDLSLFFIIPSFAKQACSPTKLAELFAMNVPVIANTKVGDLDIILDPEKNHSAVVREFTEKEYERVLDLILCKMDDNSNIRNASFEFSLEKGIELYDSVYKQLAPGKKNLQAV